MPLSESLERGWSEYETIKPKLFKLVPLIFRTYDFSEWTHVWVKMEGQFCKGADIPHLRRSQMLCLFLPQSHRCAVTLGYGYTVPLALWLSVVMGIIAY